MSTVLKHALFFLDHSIAHRLKRFRIYRVFDNIPIDSFFQLFFIHDLLMDFPSFLFARCRSLFSLHFCMLDTVNLFDKNQTVHTTNYFNHHFIDENTLHSDTHAHIDELTLKNACRSLLKSAMRKGKINTGTHTHFSMHISRYDLNVTCVGVCVYGQIRITMYFVFLFYWFSLSMMIRSSCHFICARHSSGILCVFVSCVTHIKKTNE